MREAQIALYRASPLECAKRAKLPGGNASEWIAMAQRWERLAQILQTAPMIASPSDIQRDKRRKRPPVLEGQRYPIRSRVALRLRFLQ